MRGNPYSYNHWQNLGNEGWSYADVLPYFKKAENYERGASDYHGEGGPLNVPVLLTPQSRGHLTLRSTDPTQPPAIYANYLSSEADLQPLVYAVKLSRELNQTKSYSLFRGAELYPGSQVKSDTEIIEYIRNYAETIYHPVGTCKMGHDEMAVVDNQLRVHGIEGLRVVDASIMPTIPNGNTNAPVIMIAEKAADLIAGQMA